MSLTTYHLPAPRAGSPAPFQPGSISLIRGVTTFDAADAPAALNALTRYCQVPFPGESTVLVTIRAGRPDH